MELEKQLEDNLMIIHLRGECDLAAAPELNALLSSLATDSKVNYVVLDFSGLTYIDSSGLGTLVRCDNEFRKTGGHMFLTGVKAEIETVMKITRLNSFFNIIPSIEDAKAWIEKIEST